jgi:recombination protein RecT
MGDRARRRGADREGGRAVTGTELEHVKPTDLVLRYEADYAKVLPEKFRAETFARLAQGVLRKDGALYRAAELNPRSLLVGMLDCARLGHEPGTDDYYLTPRGVLWDRRQQAWIQKPNTTPEVVGIEGYKGIIKRILNHPLVRTVIAEVVYAEDYFEFVVGDDPWPRWRPANRGDSGRAADSGWFRRDRGEMLGAFAYATLSRGGASRVAVVGPRELAAARARAAKESFLWKDHPDTAARKTAIRRASPYLPKLAELQYQQAERDVAAAEIAAERGLPELPPSELPGEDEGTRVEAEVLEGEVVDDGAEPTVDGRPLTDLEEPPGWRQ